MAELSWMELVGICGGIIAAAAIVVVPLARVAQYIEDKYETWVAFIFMAIAITLIVSTFIWVVVRL